MDINKEVLLALLDMVSQYLTVEEEYDGVKYRVLSHVFMTAGENTLDLLEKLGYVEMWDKNPTYYIFTNKVHEL
jgi:hypothetical protein